MQWIFGIYLLYMIIFAPVSNYSNTVYCKQTPPECCHTFHSATKKTQTRKDTLKVLCVFETHKRTCRAWAKHNCTPWFYDLISWKECCCKMGLRDVKSDLVCFWKGNKSVSCPCMEEKQHWPSPWKTGGSKDEARNNWGHFVQIFQTEGFIDVSDKQHEDNKTWMLWSSMFWLVFVLGCQFWKVVIKQTRLLWKS